MPVKIQIVGMKRNKGTSKRTNKAFDLCDVYFLYEDKFVEGMACGKTTMDGSKVDEKDIRVGDFLEALLFFRNYALDRVYVL